MSFQVVCISHTDGAAGGQIAREVAERLGYRYVDEEIIREAARLARVDPSVVAKTEQKQTLLQRLLDSLSSAQEALGPAALAAGFAVPIVPDLSMRRPDKDDLRGMIRAVIHEVGKRGKAVIGAHAASLALAGKSGVLRVLVTAPDSVRAGRIAKERGLSEDDAAEVIEKGDASRQEYLHAFYDIDDEHPTRYDLVINTEVLTPDEATAMIVSAVGRAAT